jgi:hypothetical protein
MFHVTQTPYTYHTTTRVQSSHHVFIPLLCLYRYDGDTGEHKETFPTKPADKAGSKNYLVRALEFSPDR